MTYLAFLFFMQYVISTKAGLVNHIEGPVNVSATESIEAGAPITTGAGGFAEVLLNPGTFLRVGENSEVVVDNVELTNIIVRVVSGSAVIEAAGVSKKQPITVTTKDVTMQLIQSGIYAFGDGKVSVLEGKLQTADSKIEFKKGWQVDKRVAYRAVKLPKNNPSAIESWSQARSEIMATMNAQVITTYRADTVFGYDAWLFSAAFGGYTYMPNRPYVSPYGRRYYAVGNVASYPGRESNTGVYNPGRTSSNPDSSVGSGVSSGGSNPAVDQPIFRDIIPEKNTPIEATVP